MPDTVPEISIIVPVYNEAANLVRLHAEIVEAMEAYGQSFEVIAVDDGSQDESYTILMRLNEQDPRWRVVRLMRNFGQHPATYAGFDHARGSIIVTIDADLQNPPSEIPKVVDKLKEGYDTVQGWRRQRQDSPFRRFLSRCVNGLVSRLTGMRIQDVGCALKAFRREAVDCLRGSQHRTRYLPAESAWHGLRLAEVEVAHREREAEKSKYGLLALIRVSFDMVASISTLPIRMFAPTGVVLSFIGFLLGFRVAYVRVAYGDLNYAGTVSAIFFVLMGMQMLATAVMCEYISRIYTEVQRRPFYIVRETSGMGGEHPENKDEASA